MNFGAHSEYTILKRVLICPPQESLRELNDEDIRNLHLEGPIDYEVAVKEHDDLISYMQSKNVEVISLSDLLRRDSESQTLLKSDPNIMFCRDVATVFESGALVMNMGLPSRRNESVLFRKAFKKMGIPIIGEFEPGGTCEGGSVTFLDERTLAISNCSRVNDAGIKTFQKHLLGKGIDKIVVVDVPDGSVHIDGFMTHPTAGHIIIRANELKDKKCRIIESKGVQESFFLNELEKSGNELHPFEDKTGMALNVVWLNPLEGIAFNAKNIEKVKEITENLGGSLTLFPGEEFTKGLGGAHCATCPILRVEV